MKRRTFLMSATASAATTWLSLPKVSAADAPALIIDTHQHLWDLTKFQLPWLESFSGVLKQTYHLNEYREAIRGLNVQAVYMEVYVANDQLVAEAEHAIALSKERNPTVGAVIGARPESADFPTYVERFAKTSEVKGMRRVLHKPETPPGLALSEPFVSHVRLLGERGLMFDLTMRPTELADAARLAELCPDTRFVLDHCGNGDPLAFRNTVPADMKPAHTAEEWKRGIDRVAARSNVIVKISGVIASLPKGGDANDLAPIVNYCLDAFGPDRVVFGSDWPVCLLGGTLRTWIEMLVQIVASRPAAEQQKLWSSNAARHYALK